MVEISTWRLSLQWCNANGQCRRGTEGRDYGPSLNFCLLKFFSRNAKLGTENLREITSIHNFIGRKFKTVLSVEKSQLLAFLTLLGPNRFQHGPIARFMSIIILMRHFLCANDVCNINIITVSGRIEVVATPTEDVRFCSRFELPDGDADAMDVVTLRPARTAEVMLYARLAADMVLTTDTHACRLQALCHRIKAWFPSPFIATNTTRLQTWYFIEIISWSLFF